MPRVDTNARRIAEELDSQLPPAHARRFSIEATDEHITIQFDDCVTVPGVPGRSDLWDYIEAVGLRVTGLNFDAKTVILES